MYTHNQFYTKCCHNIIMFSGLARRIKATREMVEIILCDTSAANQPLTLVYNRHRCRPAPTTVFPALISPY
jgi:hypothetical protein